jgi:hypothetical protein
MWPIMGSPRGPGGNGYGLDVRESAQAERSMMPKHATPMIQESPNRRSSMLKAMIG